MVTRAEAEEMIVQLQAPHKGIGGSGIFINYAIWESCAQLKKAVTKADFQTRLSKYLASTTVSPHILKSQFQDLCADYYRYGIYNNDTHVKS